MVSAVFTIHPDMRVTFSYVAFVILFFTMLPMNYFYCKLSFRFLYSPANLIQSMIPAINPKQ